jgi:hypothetical protein
MPSKTRLVLRSAQEARLEGRTIAMQPARQFLHTLEGAIHGPAAAVASGSPQDAVTRPRKEELWNGLAAGDIRNVGFSEILSPRRGFRRQATRQREAKPYQLNG